MRNDVKFHFNKNFLIFLLPILIFIYYLKRRSLYNLGVDESGILLHKTVRIMQKNCSMTLTVDSKAGLPDGIYERMPDG